jgi:hypothetical protein
MRVVPLVSRRDARWTGVVVLFRLLLTHRGLSRRRFGSRTVRRRVDESGTNDRSCRRCNGLKFSHAYKLAFDLIRNSEDVVVRRQQTRRETLSVQDMQVQGGTQGFDTRRMRIAQMLRAFPQASRGLPTRDDTAYPIWRLPGPTLRPSSRPPASST